MAEERLKLAVFVDFDNIQIGVKDTLAKDLDISLVLEALKERGEVVTKVAYGDWSRAGDQSRQMTQHAVQMVQRNVTPRGDKNGADINLALDALEMAFTRHHITAFAIVGGDSDFIALVEKLKQYDKRVIVVGGRAFTSNILQRNCTEFIAYENLLKGGAGGDGSRAGRVPRRGEATAQVRALADALPNVRRALKVLEDREVSPQLGLLKSTLLQLDSTFSERDYGAGSFLEFVQKMEQAGLVSVRRTDRGYLVEAVDPESKPRATHEVERRRSAETAERVAPDEAAVEAPVAARSESPAVAQPEPALAAEEAMALLRAVVRSAWEKAPNRPLYLRQVRQGLRAADKNFDERRYGARGVLDLLYQGQREGWWRLQRDRKGVLRILAPPPAASAPAAATGEAEVPALEAAGEVANAAESEVAVAGEVSEASAPEREVAAAEEPAFARSSPVIGEAAGGEPAGELLADPATERKTRRQRAAGAKPKSGARKSGSRRKRKEPTEE